MSKSEQDKIEAFSRELKILLSKYGIEFQNLISMNVIISHDKNRPVVSLRRKTSDPDIIRRLITAAWYRQPLIIMPQFKDTLQSINTAIEKGIMFKNKDGKFEF